MSIGSIVKQNQPDVYRKLVKIVNEEKVHKNDDNLDFDDFERMMRHDGYKRIRGSTRQVRHG